MSDLIDRRSAIESIRECAEDAHDNREWDMEQGYLNAIDCIEEEPSAEPQWVLCSERLPESDGRYLVTTAVGFCKVTTMRFWTGQYWWQVESTQAVLDMNVLAWAELPEPC